MRGSGLGPRGTVHAMGLAASSSMSSMWALLLLASSAAAAAAAAAAALACAVDGEMGVGVEWLAAEADGGGGASDGAPWWLGVEERGCGWPWWPHGSGFMSAAAATWPPPKKNNVIELVSLNTVHSRWPLSLASDRSIWLSATVRNSWN